MMKRLLPLFLLLMSVPARADLSRGSSDATIVDSTGNYATITGSKLDTNAYQGGTWTTGRTWSLSSGSDSISCSVSNFPATQAVTQSGSWTTGRTWTLSSGTDSVSVAGTIATTNASVGATGSAVPASATQVGGSDGTNLRAIKVSSTGVVSVDGSATTQPISAASLPLPAGASTSALQTTGNSSLSSIDTKTPALGQTTMSASSPVAIASNQSAIPVTQSGAWTVQPGNTANTTAWLVTGTGGTFPATQSGTWNINNVSGTVSLPTGASTSALQTSGNATLTSIDAGIPAALGQTTMSASMPVVLASDQSAVPISGTVTINPLTTTTLINVNSIPTDGTKTSYSATVNGLVVAAAATDIFTITGSASKIVRITRIEISGTTTVGSGVSFDASLIRRSTNDTGGTSTTRTNVTHDTTNPSATSVVKAYTANPTLGTAVGSIRSSRVSLPTLGGIMTPYTWDFGTRPSQAIVLRGAAQELDLNFNAITITNPVVDVAVEWTEE